MELYENTLAALSGMLKDRKVSSQELTQSVFENIHRQEPEVQAYITLCEEQAMEQAKEADRLLSQGQGSALTGIPLGLKDNLCTEGVLTTCASKMLYNFRPPYSCHGGGQAQSPGSGVYRQAEHGRVCPWVLPAKPPTLKRPEIPGI